jgi:hypothetical protein
MTVINGSVFVYVKGATTVEALENPHIIKANPTKVILVVSGGERHPENFSFKLNPHRTP